MKAHAARTGIGLIIIAYFIPFFAEDILLLQSSGIVSGTEFLLIGLIVGLHILGGFVEAYRGTRPEL